MSINSDLLRKASAHVRTLFLHKQSYPGLYHNYDHTVEVVDNAAEIAEALSISRSDAEIVLLAAWFHDTGYLDTRHEHEERSAMIASEFLKKEKYPSEKTEKVIGCIRATKVPQKPATLLEQVMADADLLHLGKKGSIEKGELLRREMENAAGIPITDTQWLRQSISFFQNHSYHTVYAVREYGERRDKNLVKLQKKLRKVESQEWKSGKSGTGTLVKEKKPGRGVETMFRVASQNHMELSSIADNKANIMISVPSIIISIVTTILFGRLSENPELMIPTFMLMLVCAATIVFAILSTRPKVTSGNYSRNEIKEKKINLLFFGNFYGMQYDDYHWGMNELMKDKDLLYDTMIKDIYYLGQVLGIKYKYLRISYNIFLYGLISSVLAFIIAFMVYGVHL